MRQEPDRLGMPLSPRQEQVIDRLAEGDTYDEAAKHLGISRETLKNHAGRAFVRLGARSSAHAVALRERRRGQSATDAAIARAPYGREACGHHHRLGDRCDA